MELTVSSEILWCVTDSSWYWNRSSGAKSIPEASLPSGLFVFSEWHSGSLLSSERAACPGFPAYEKQQGLPPSQTPNWQIPTSACLLVIGLLPFIYLFIFFNLLFCFSETNFPYKMSPKPKVLFCFVCLSFFSWRMAVEEPGTCYYFY